ncbi:hypothetical protein KIN20_033314 [Parelaphostrongylus tenuis]|uniref:Uncharacterized protein n=1 Tax=Parelaphostrongylus tenuis TaxID=148309 RepID=A0AAD5R8D6_PARTN|nr:hypothetical protein KIN20_033314 [Parelaphostrongylus tenuis]
MEDDKRGVGEEEVGDAGIEAAEARLLVMTSVQSMMGNSAPEKNLWVSGHVLTCRSVGRPAHLVMAGGKRASKAAGQ